MNKSFFQSCILSLFMSAIVLGMASCGDEPESKDFTFQIEFLSNKIHYIVTPVKKDVYFYCGCMVYTDGVEQTLKEITEDKEQVPTHYNPISKGEPKERTMDQQAPDTRYIVWACYVEIDPVTKDITVVSDISSKIFKTMPDGALNGEFTVNAQGKKVHFGKGNLKQDADLFYRMFDHQWEYLYSSESAPIDLFPWSAIENYTHNYEHWYVLSFDEWQYLLFHRDNAEKLFTLATLTINDKNVYGLILFPDNWDNSDKNITTCFDMGIHKDEKYYSDEMYYTQSLTLDGYAYNVIEQSQWEKLEFAGAVFLPANHTYYIESKSNYGGLYWSSSTSPDKLEGNACDLIFTKDALTITRVGSNKTETRAIRPVRVVE